MDDIIITLELTDYLPDEHEFKATYEGKEIRVDPFVGGVWDNYVRDLGTFTFEGHWYRYDKNVFIVYEQLI